MSFETSINVNVQEIEETDDCIPSSRFDYIKEFEDLWEAERLKFEEQENDKILENCFESLLVCVVNDPAKSI